jgi:hypothetical protein
MMRVALLTGDPEGDIFKSGIYFQHPVNSTKCINYELHQF